MNYLHYKKSKEDVIKSYYIALIPLIIFSIYKNGILLYQNSLIHFYKILMPLYFLGISALVALVISKILKISSKELILESLIVGCSISINTNMIIYPILLFVSLFILEYIKKDKKMNINDKALLHLILLLALFINSYSYLNIGEKLGAFSYNLFDIFLGHTSGGIASFSLFFIIISFIILACNPFYKKKVAIFSSISYLVVLLILFLIFQKINYLNLMLSGNAYFSFVFIASDLYISPYSENGMIVYGIIIGAITGLIVTFLPYESAYIATLMGSIIIPFINHYQNKKFTVLKAKV